MTPISVYTAGPSGFSESGRDFHNGRLLPMLRGIGYEILDPWKLTDETLIQSALNAPEGSEQRQEYEKLNPIIGQNNEGAIRLSSIVVAVLDGPDVDSGTASEIGFASALGKPVVGYRSDFRLSSENIGATVNIQVEYFIRRNGGKVVATLDSLRLVMAVWYDRLKN